MGSRRADTRQIAQEPLLGPPRDAAPPLRLPEPRLPGGELQRAVRTKHSLGRRGGAEAQPPPASGLTRREYPRVPAADPVTRRGPLGAPDPARHLPPSLPAPLTMVRGRAPPSGRAGLAQGASPPQAQPTRTGTEGSR